jgi:hypothetical protein
MTHTDTFSDGATEHATLQVSAPAPGLSERYRFVPTQQIIAELGGHGFVPVSYQEQRVYKAQRRGFQKHMVRLRRAKERLRVRDSVAEVVVVNSHDGSAALSLTAGIFRLVCSNGLMVSVKTIPEARIVHREYSGIRLKNAIEQIAGALPQIERTAELWQEQLLPQHRILEFAEQAARLRWPNKERRPHIDFSQLSAAKRSADAVNSIWNVYNRVQERLLQGGFEVTFGRNNAIRTARPLTGLERIITLNRDLWDLAASFATN